MGSIRNERIFRTGQPFSCLRHLRIESRSCEIRARGASHGEFEMVFRSVTNRYLTTKYVQLDRPFTQQRMLTEGQLQQ